MKIRSLLMNCNSKIIKQIHYIQNTYMQNFVSSFIAYVASNDEAKTFLVWVSLLKMVPCVVLLTWPWTLSGNTDSFNAVLTNKKKNKTTQKKVDKINACLLFLCNVQQPALCLWPDWVAAPALILLLAGLVPKVVGRGWQSYDRNAVKHICWH